MLFGSRSLPEVLLPKSGWNRLCGKVQPKTVSMNQKTDMKQSRMNRGFDILTVREVCKEQDCSFCSLARRCSVSLFTCRSLSRA
jgi:hypothetical protein